MTRLLSPSSSFCMLACLQLSYDFLLFGKVGLQSQAIESEC